MPQVINADTRISPNEIIATGRWHSALFMSFALSLSFFEAVPLIALRKSGCRSVAVLADLEGYRVSISEAGVSQVGRTYEVAPVSVSKGIFHPKIMLLNGPNGPRAAVGSGNLTFNGWGGNLEMLDYLTPSAAGGVFEDLANFLNALQSTGRVDAIWPDLSGFIEACRTAGQEDGNAARTRLLHTLERSIADQVADVASDLGGARSVTVVSPFFKSIGAIEALALKLSVDDISAVVPQATPEHFPFSLADAAGLKVKPVTAQMFSEDRRRLHAKLIEVRCRRGLMQLSGSINCTGPALTEVTNVEAGILRIQSDADLFGWVPTARPIGPGSGGQMPSRSSQPVLIAHFDGTSFTGRILGMRNPPSIWQVALVDELKQTDISQSVAVNSEGEFKVRINSSSSDVWQARSSVRLIMRSGAHEVAGWVMLATYLAAIRERGPVAEALIRIVSGPEDQTDLAIILGYFTENPGALLSVSPRRGSSRPTDDREPVNGEIYPDELVPVSRTDATRSGSNGHARSAFEQLLDRFREHISGNPASETELSEEEEDEEESGRKGRRSSSRGRRKIRHGDFFRLIEAIVDRIEKRPEGDEERRRDLLMLLQLGVFFSARAEDAVDLRIQFLDRWVALVMMLTRPIARVDELEKMLCIVQLGEVISKQSAPEEVLAALQRRLRGEPSANWADDLRSALDLSRTNSVIPGVTVQEWLDAFDRVTASRTPWMDAIAVWKAVKARAAIASTNLLLREPEATKLQLIAAGQGDNDEVVAVELEARRPSCPVHHMALPAIQASRFRTLHIATAASCCNRILLNLIP